MSRQRASQGRLWDICSGRVNGTVLPKSLTVCKKAFTPIENCRSPWEGSRGIYSGYLAGFETDFAGTDNEGAIGCTAIPVRPGAGLGVK